MTCGWLTVIRLPISSSWKTRANTWSSSGGVQFKMLFHAFNATVQARHHRAAERLLERLDELLLIVCLDVLSTSRLCETSHIDRALPARPEGRHAKAYDVHGELVASRGQHLAQITGRAAACLLAVGEHDDGARFGSEIENLRACSTACVNGVLPAGFNDSTISMMGLAALG